ncbi:MAG: hypothetical protein AAGB01_01205 [Cyanobacteria bacterium P01_F01_bin.42]
MKRLITTTALLSLFTTSVLSASLISKANAANTDSLPESVSLENSIEDQQITRYGDCYYDTYGNLHCW